MYRLQSDCKQDDLSVGIFTGQFTVWSVCRLADLLTGQSYSLRFYQLTGEAVSQASFQQAFLPFGRQVFQPITLQINNGFSILVSPLREVAACGVDW